MTTTDTGNALLKAIVANPEEDTPRLVYADYLQENGDDERAEFIRVQVQLSRTEYPDLRARESALLAANHERWLRVLCPACGGSGFNAEIDWPASNGCMACDGSGEIGGLTESVHPTTFARGFLDCVEGCLRRSVFERAFVSRPDDSTKTHRAGAWVPTAWILRVFAHHPTITRVPRADKRPEQVDIDYWSGWTWFVGDASFAHSPIHVTNDIWHKMPTTWYATEAAANDALARAVADVVRAASQQPQE